MTHSIDTNQKGGPPHMSDQTNWQPPDAGTAKGAVPSNFDGWITITESNVPTITVGQAVYVRATDGKLTVQAAGVSGTLLATWPAGAWSWRQESVEFVERRRPTWAIVLGVIGLLFFLIGLLFFFVKTDHRETKRAVRVWSGDQAFVGRYP